MTELKPCPFCGDDPWVGGYDGGTDYEGPRCCWGSVDFQIVDIIPDETRFSEDAYNKETQQYRDDIVAFAADYAVKEWNTRQSPWISVEDRLPEEQGFYFSLDDCGRGNVDWFSGKDFENEYLTHWMPIPPTQGD